MASRTALVLSVVALTACSRSRAAPRPADDAGAGVALAQPGSDLVPLRESAREVLDRNCGECHTTGSPLALKRALAVYDLAQLDWSAHMTDAQLRDAEGRLHGDLAPTRDEDEARPMQVTPQELDRFHAFVEQEIARRAAR